MFPERLSEDLMSLVEGKERPALTFCMDFDEDFNKIDNSEEVLESAIIVKKRLTFLEAEGLIIDDTDENGGETRKNVMKLTIMTN
jgi:exoribonuclease R